MPVRAGIVCLWAESKNSARSIDYTDDQLAIGVIAHKRVIVAGKSLHIALCRSPALHDGRQCRLTVESADGVWLESKAQIALADWSSPHFPRVLRYLCEGALSPEVRSDGVGGLERFLGFRAAWRVETVGSARVGQSIVTVAGLALNENARIEAFVWDGLNLNSVKPQVIACGETSIFVWTKDAGGIGYFGHQKRLLEIETETTRPGARARIVAMLGGLAADELDRVVKGLAAALPVPDWTGLDALLRAALTAPIRDRTLPAEARSFADPWRLQGVYRTGAHIFVLTRHTQGETGAPEPVALTWFGEASGERLVTVQSGIRPGTQDAIHLHQLPAPPALKPYGFCAVHRLASNETVWVPIRELSEPGAVAELQASLDFEKAGDAVLADLHAPMQHALAEMHLGTRPERRLCAGSVTDGHGGAAAPAVIVLSDGDPGAVELTLVGLISTIGAAPYRLLLVLRAEDDAEHAADALERYARHSNARAELVLGAARRPLSTTLKLLLAGEGAGDGAGDGLLRDVVLLPAGTVLVGRDWWARLTDELACHPDALFVGQSAAGRPVEAAGSFDHAAGPARRPYRDPVPALAWREPELPQRLHGGLDTVEGLVAGLVRAASGRAGIRNSSALRTIERPRTVSSGTIGRIRLDQAVIRTYERPAPARPIVQLVQGKGSA